MNLPEATFDAPGGYQHLGRNAVTPSNIIKKVTMFGETALTFFNASSGDNAVDVGPEIEPRFGLIAITLNNSFDRFDTS